MNELNEWLNAFHCSLNSGKECVSNQLNYVCLYVFYNFEGMRIYSLNGFVFVRQLVLGIFFI